MRILIDGRMILPEMTGVGRYLLGLCRALAELDSDLDYELWLQENIPGNHPIFQLSGKRFLFRRVPLRQTSLLAQLRFHTYLQDPKPDLLHCPHFDLPFHIPGKVVATIHDLKYLVHPEFFPHLPGLRRSAMRKMMVYTCERAQALICDAHFTAADLQSLLSVPNEKIQTIYLGVDAARFGKQPAAAVKAFREKHALQKPFILFVGERRPHKNLPGLIQAFARFQELGGDEHQLVIAGRAYRDYTLPEQTAASLDLTDKVRFLDHFPETELDLLYQSADLLALLSFYEGFGLPILEAMASGTPIVASTGTSLPEVAGDAGLLVPADDPLSAAQAFTRLIPGGDARQTCIQRGLERAHGFTWERCARQTETVYRKVIET